MCGIGGESGWELYSMSAEEWDCEWKLQVAMFSVCQRVDMKKKYVGICVEVDPEVNDVQRQRMSAWAREFGKKGEIYGGPCRECGRAKECHAGYMDRNACFAPPGVIPAMAEQEETS